MKLSDLTKLLKSGEWNDVEFKEARTDVPKPAFEAVSAFANTRGGYLVFGVTQNGENYEITGVDKPDKVQSDFLTVLRADLRINHDVVINEQKLRIQEKTVRIRSRLFYRSRRGSLGEEVCNALLQELHHAASLLLTSL